MIYLSLKDKIEKNSIMKIIKELNIKDKVYDESKFEDDSLDNLKKSKIVICELDIEKIKDYLALKKIVIVFKRNKTKLKNDENNILYEKNVYTYSGKNELREILSYQMKITKTKRTIFLTATPALILLIATILTLSFGSNINKTQGKMNLDGEIVTKKDSTKPVEKDKVKEETEKVDYKKENIVFYGDSITDFYNMDTFYENLPVINSGTSGFQTKDLLSLVEERVYIYNPTKVFIMIGTNDIAFTDLTNEELVENIYIEPIYPVNKNTDNEIVKKDIVGIRENKRISEINKILKEMCEKEKLTYIDMYDLLTDKSGDLDLDYTVDGLHINEKGYEVITKKLMEYIDPSTKKERY